MLCMSHSSFCGLNFYAHTYVRTKLDNTPIAMQCMQSMAVQYSQNINYHFFVFPFFAYIKIKLYIFFNIFSFILLNKL